MGTDPQTCSVSQGNSSTAPTPQSHAKEKVQMGKTYIAINFSFELPFSSLLFTKLPRMNHSPEIDAEHDDVWLCLVMLLSSSTRLCSTVTHTELQPGRSRDCNAPLHSNIHQLPGTLHLPLKPQVSKQPGCLSCCLQPVTNKLFLLQLVMSCRN